MFPRIAVLILLAPLAGCLLLGGLPPSIPEVSRPNLPEDKFLELDARTITETVNYTKKTGEDCIKGTNDCVEHRERRSKQVDVRVASATIDGRPIAFDELAAAASPDYVRDTERGSGLMSACRRGRVLMAVGATAILAGLTMLQIGFDEQKPNRNLAIAGYATTGAGIVGLGGGWVVFGGQHCKEAGAIYERWRPVYTHPNATSTRGDAAEMYESLANAFNKRRGQTEAPTAEAPTDESADDAEVTP